MDTPFFASQLYIFEGVCAPGLRCIGFAGYRFRDATELQSLLARSIDLKRLDLIDVSLEKAYFGDPVASPQRVVLDKLYMVFNFSNSRAKSLVHTFTTVDIRHLRSLDLRLGDCNVLKTLLKASALTIEEVTLRGIADRGYGDVVEDPEPDMLEGNNVLRTIEIRHSRVCDTVTALRFFGILRNLRSLKTITLDISRMKSEDEAHWKTLDALFADSGELLSVLSLHVQMKALDKELVTRMLPTISGRAIMDLEEKRMRRVDSASNLRTEFGFGEFLEESDEED
ncbi:hypothetical protein C8J57DRAFT_1508700 [Mycena rebaudengoi]|nr:hypothetical protein C8J57DRAFT_1508700 [Mycena rebaudengoi]